VAVVGDIIRTLLVTRSLATQEAKDADALPTAVLRRNGAATAATVTVVDVGTGRYQLTATLAAGQGWLHGDHYALDATWTMEATVGLAEVVLQGQVAPSVAVEAESAPDTDRTIRRGDTATIPFTGLGDLAGRTALLFTAKASAAHTDEQSILQVTEADGLVRLNGAEPEAGDEVNAAIDVTDEATGDLTVTVAAVAAVELSAPARLRYDVQAIFPASVETRAEGLLAVTDDITRAIE
jgi:hypothetical protein